MRKGLEGLHKGGQVIGTANYLDPTAARQIAAGVAEYAARHGVSRVADLTGALQLPGS